MQLNNILKNLLIELVQIPSVSSNIGALHEIVDFVEKQFEGINNAYIKNLNLI